MAFLRFIDEIDDLEDRRRRLPRILRDRSNPFEEYEDSQFKARFRFSKETVRDLLTQVGDELRHDTRGVPLTPAQQLFVTLRFYATGAFHKVVGDTIKVHESSVCRAVACVTTAICRLRNAHISFPAGQELPHVKNHFSHISGDNFPGIVGCVDGTHIKIFCHTINQAAAYMNRKGFYSINCQVICDGNLKFRNIVARWPGSTHDSRIFRNSSIRDRLEGGEINGHLLGDSGYPCTRYLLTPIRNPNGIAEERYNRALTRARNTVERSIGTWKRRFPCLAYGLRTKMETTLQVIVATAVLHNLAIDRREDIIGEEIPIEEVIPEVAQEHDINGNRWRRLIIQNHFV